MARSTSQRLALFIPTLHCGGAERITVNLIRAAVERGLPVDLILARAEGPFLAGVPDAVRVIELKAAKLQHGISRLARYLRSERPYGVISHLTQANVAILLADLLAGLASRIVAVEHINWAEQLACRAIRPRVQLLARCLYWRAEQVVAVSEGAARSLERCLGWRRGRVRTIYNPVVDEQMSARAAGPSPHSWLAGGDSPVMIAVGRLHPQKDYPTLLRAMASVRKTRPARLIIFGEGPEREHLEQLRRELGLEDVVDLPGVTGNPYAAMRRASLLVLSSSFEGLPTVLIESLACGCPVISTDCPNGPSEILDHGRYGALVPPGDHRGLAKAMLAALGRPVDREALKHRGAEFSCDRALDEYLRALNYPAAAIERSCAA